MKSTPKSPAATTKKPRSTSAEIEAALFAPDDEQQAAQAEVTRKIEQAKKEPMAPQPMARAPAPVAVSPELMMNERRIAFLEQFRGTEKKNAQQLADSTGQDLKLVRRHLRRFVKWGWAAKEGRGELATYTAHNGKIPKDLTPYTKTARVRREKGERQPRAKRSRFESTPIIMISDKPGFISVEPCFVLRDDNGVVVHISNDRSALEEGFLNRQATAALWMRMATENYAAQAAAGSLVPQLEASVLQAEKPKQAEVIQLRHENPAKKDVRPDVLVEKMTEEQVRSSVRLMQDALGFPGLNTDVVFLPALGSSFEVDVKAPRVLFNLDKLNAMPRTEAKKKMADAVSRIVFRKKDSKSPFGSAKHKELMNKALAIL